MPQKLSYMVDINPEDIYAMIRKKGITRTEAARRIIPYYDKRGDSYRAFAGWMRKKKIPRHIYEDLEEILNGTL